MKVYKLKITRIVKDHRIVNVRAENLKEAHNLVEYEYINGNYVFADVECSHEIKYLPE